MQGPREKCEMKATLRGGFSIFYSDLKASTGSFLDAALAGINPPIKVKTTESAINITAETN